MIVPHITDHALLRWMERAHGVDVEAWRALMRDELRASFDNEGLRRATHGPAFVCSRDGEKVITYLATGWEISKFGDGIGVARSLDRATDAA